MQTLRFGAAYPDPPFNGMPDDGGLDIDLMTTYVGGSAACIAELVATEGLEAFPVPIDQRVVWDADTVNPPPLGAPD